MENENKNIFEAMIARYVNQFIRIMHVVFSLALVITVALTMFVFAQDIYHIFVSGNLVEGTVHALGSLLVLWTLSELLHSESRALIGERIQVTVFIEVAIAAFVRKLLVASTEGVTLEGAAVYLVSLLVLSIVYGILHVKCKK